MAREVAGSSPRSGLRPGLRAGALSLLLAWGCSGISGGSSAPPSPGEFSGSVPDLRGSRVLVLPVQSVEGFPPGTGSPAADAELAFALGERGPAVEWVLPDEIRRVLARSPGVQVTPDALPVGPFLRGSVQRVGDPLFGDLIRLSALTSTQVALIPVRVRSGQDAVDGTWRVEILGTFLDVRSGRVLWTGVVDGRGGTGLSFEGELLVAADSFARTVVR